MSRGLDTSEDENAGLYFQGRAHLLNFYSESVSEPVSGLTNYSKGAIFNI